MQLFDEILPALDEAHWCAEAEGRAYALIDLGEEKIGVAPLREVRGSDVRILEVVHERS